MKRLSLLLCLIPFALSANSFERGDVIISAGLDLGIYGTEGYNPVDSIRNKDNAVSGLIPIAVEVGLSNNIGVGAVVRLNSFATNKDSSSAGNTDFSVFANYHFLRNPFFNMYLGLKYGLSNFNYKNKIDLGEFKATGGHFQAELGANFFPGKHIGFNVHAGYDHLNFKNGKIEDVSGNKSDYELYLKGANIGAALLIKF